MKTLGNLISRNTKLFFKDKGIFFTSLIAPLILLLLFVTFLGEVYKDSFYSCLPTGVTVDEELVNGFVGGWLLSSLLAVSCVSVAFSANLIMVSDKVKGIRNDLTITPVKSAILSLSYYISTALITCIICFVTTGIGLFYLSQVGWFFTLKDVLLILLDVFIMVLFGTALSSVVCAFIKNQGGITAVTTIVCSAYGFLCGAYMPIDSFSPAIKNFIMALPGTYGTGLLHTHFMGGCFDEMSDLGFPTELVDAVKKGFDCRLYFNDSLVETPTMYIVLLSAIAVLVLAYLLVNWLKRKA